MNLDIAIVAHHDRRVLAEKLADTVGANIIAWDSGRGARETHERAWSELWELRARNDAHWAMVIEDDAITGSWFRPCMCAALKVAPSAVVSAYLGRGRPADWQHSIATVMATQVDWLCAPVVLSGVGVAIRGDKLGDMLDTCAPSEVSRSAVLRRWAAMPFDEALDFWVTQRGLTVSYTHPSLLDHDPELPSLIGTDRSRTHTVEVPVILGAHVDPDYRRAWHFAEQKRWGPTRAEIPTPEALRRS